MPGVVPSSECGPAASFSSGEGPWLGSRVFPGSGPLILGGGFRLGISPADPLLQAPRVHCQGLPLPFSPEESVTLLPQGLPTPPCGCRWCHRGTTLGQPVANVP